MGEPDDQRWPVRPYTALQDRDRQIVTWAYWLKKHAHFSARKRSLWLVRCAIKWSRNVLSIMELQVLKYHADLKTNSVLFALSSFESYIVLFAGTGTSYAYPILSFIKCCTSLLLSLYFSPQCHVTPVERMVVKYIWFVGEWFVCPPVHSYPMALEGVVSFSCCACWIKEGTFWGKLSISTQWLLCKKRK